MTSLADLVKKSGAAKTEKSQSTAGANRAKEKTDKQMAILENMEKDKKAQERFLQKQKELAELKSQRIAEGTYVKAAQDGTQEAASSPPPPLRVDGFLVSFLNGNIACARSDSMAMMHVGDAMGTPVRKSEGAIINVGPYIFSAGMMPQVNAALFCDPALTYIISEAKPTQFVSTQGQQQTGSYVERLNSPQKSPGPSAPKPQKARSESPSSFSMNGSKSKCPGPRYKNVGTSKFSGPPARQTKSKSPVPTTKAGANGKKISSKVEEHCADTEKLPLLVQFDPFLVEMVGFISTASTNAEQTLMIVSPPHLTTQKRGPKSGSMANCILFQYPPSYLEVEPLMSRMVPDEIADAINLALVKRLGEEEMTEQAELMVSPAKSPENFFMTPPKDFKGRVAFFERLTKQKAEKKSPWVKGMMFEKVLAELPQDMTPMAQKRDRVDKFFEKADDVPPIPPATKTIPIKTWTKVETAPPAAIDHVAEETTAEEKEAPTEPAPRAEKLVSSMKNDLSDATQPVGLARAPTNGKTKKSKDRSKSPNRRKGKSPSVEVSSSEANQGKISKDAILPSSPLPAPLKSESLAELNGLTSTAATEEAHWDWNIATEVLEDCDDSDDHALKALVANRPMEEFPSLADTSLSSRRSAETAKSYAQVLAQGKKREQEKSLNAKYSQYLDFIPSLSFEEKVSFTGDVKTIVVNSAAGSKQAADSAKGGIAKDKSVDAGEAERVKMKEMAQRLAEGAPQKKLERNFKESGPVEESKGVVDVDPGFKTINGEPKKKTIVRDVGPDAPQPSELGSQSRVVAADTPVTAKEAFRQANFNQFSALADLGDIPTEIVPTEEWKKGKTRGLITVMHPKKKAVRLGGAATKEPKGSKKKTNDAMDFLPEPAHSAPFAAIPLDLLNNLVQTRVTSYIVDGLFWAFALLLACPLGAFGIVLITIFRLLEMFLRLLGAGIIKPKKTPGQKLAVVITGCDSGFGKDLASALLKEGFVVFCGCLRKESLKAFEKEELAMPILMDVTKDSDVDKARQKVEEWLAEADDRYLHALVNNAGLGTSGLVDWVPVSEMQKMIDVNFLGMVRCCKKFLPRFKAQAAEGAYSSARIVNMVSMAGLVSGGLFSVGYEASKHAAEAFSSSLRLEMKSFGLKVTLINPSFHKTDITKVMTDELKRKWKALTPEKRKEYGEDYISLASRGSSFASSVINWDSKNVVTAMLKSVAWKNPPPRMLVGVDAKYILLLVRMLPTWVSAHLLSLKSKKLSRRIQKNKVY